MHGLVDFLLSYVLFNTLSIPTGKKLFYFGAVGSSQGHRVVARRTLKVLVPSVLANDTVKVGYELK